MTLIVKVSYRKIVILPEIEDERRKETKNPFLNVLLIVVIRHY